MNMHKAMSEQELKGMVLLGHIHTSSLKLQSQMNEKVVEKAKNFYINTYAMLNFNVTYSILRNI